ncbi:MAG: site-specific integrase [Lentisphaeria bacterium]|nr:site-specific integrase [Lentisphaeria bacterium]
MALRKIGKYWHCYFRDLEGKLRTLSSHETDKSEARKFEQQMMKLVDSRRSHRNLMRFLSPEDRMKAELIEAEIKAKSPEVSSSPRSGLKLSAMFDLASKRRKLGTSHKYAWDRFLQEVPYKYAKEITPKIALEYLNKNYSSGNGKSFNNVKSCLNTIFRCCLVEANLSASPFGAILNRSVIDINSHRNMTGEEFDIIFSKANKYTQIMMMLSRWTAQRLETCARITPGMLDFERKVFVIQPGKTKRFKKWVCCPIFPQLENYIKPILENCPDPETPIVENFNYCGNKNFSWNFSGLLKKLQIPDTEEGSICFHSIRGTAITWMKENGIKGEELRAITGHTSNEVEDIYARDIATISKIANTFSKNG